MRLALEALMILWFRLSWRVMELIMASCGRFRFGRGKSPTLRIIPLAPGIILRTLQWNRDFDHVDLLHEVFHAEATLFQIFDHLLLDF